jgi:protein TonB
MDEMAMSDLTIEQKPSRPIWILAAVGALAIHLAGAAWAVAHLQTDDPGDGLGANAIEVGLEPASPRLEATDLPAGPDMEASVASTAREEQKAEVKQSELPKDLPTEAEVPDRVVAPNDQQQPKEDDPKIAAVQTTASTESVATEATARQSLENAAEKDHMVAPNSGIAKDLQRLSADWNRRLSAYFEQHKRYPKVHNAKSAKVKVAFVLNRLGHVLSVNVERSSGDTAFDEAAVSMIRRSDPVPRPPVKITDEIFSRSLEVTFTEEKSASR